MKAPAFWWQPAGPASVLLAPVAAVWGLLAGRRLLQPRARPPLPTLLVGNLVAGGAGKTPVTLALAARAMALGLRPGLVSRGYGGRLAGPVRVDPALHTAADVGDEALLLAARAATVIGRDRAAALREIATAGLDLALVDDGLQNPAVPASLVVAVIDGEVGLGNGRVMPAGPLRAPLRRQEPCLDAVVVLGAGPGRTQASDLAARLGVPLLAASLETTGQAALAGRRLYAFAGIGRPEKVFTHLERLGLDVAGRRAFADHHPFTQVEAAEILAEARRLGAVPVTTEKDMARLAGGAGDVAALAAATTVITVRAVFEAEDAADSLIGRAMAAAGQSPARR